MNIDYERLLLALKNIFLEEELGNYDLDGIVHNAELCWDDTAVMVKSSDFEFVFDIVSYDVLSVKSDIILK